MRNNMDQILENLAYVIGEENLKKMSEETVAAMMAPFAKPFAGTGEGPSYEPGVDEDDTGDNSSEDVPLGKKPVPEKEVGDPSFYGKETVKSDYPYAKAGKLESKSPLKEGISTSKTTTVPDAKLPSNKEIDPEGDYILGTGKDEKGGDKSFYGSEKKLKDYPYANPGKKPGASEAREIAKLQALSEEDPNAAPPSIKKDPVQAASPKEDPKPSKQKEEPPAEPAPKEKPEWEVYVTSADLDAIAARAIEALKDKVGHTKAMLVVKFKADDAAAAAEALKAAGFDVVGIEQEK